MPNIDITVLLNLPVMTDADVRRAKDDLEFYHLGFLELERATGESRQTLVESFKSWVGSRPISIKGGMELCLRRAQAGRVLPWVEEDLEDEVEMLRTFHGKSPYD